MMSIIDDLQITRVDKVAGFGQELTDLETSDRNGLSTVMVPLCVYLVIVSVCLSAIV